MSKAKRPKARAAKKPPSKAGKETAAPHTSGTPGEDHTQNVTVNPTDAVLDPLGALQDGSLLETCRSQWQYGEWHQLAVLDDEVIAQDVNRARVAVLVAAALTHQGETDRARHLAAQALRWGAERRVVTRVMLSAVENSLGRTAALLEDDSAARHFKTAIQLVEPRADADLLGRTRHVRETLRLGMSEDVMGMLGDEVATLRQAPADYAPRLSQVLSELSLLRHEQAARKLRRAQDHSRLPTHADGEGGALSGAVLVNPAFNRDAYETYRAISPETGGQVLLETKSLPRSGLHYLRNSLADILGRDFSFCEWYGEPGCCRKHPCSMTGVAETAGRFHLRLIKSHDFQGDDPAYPVGGHLQRMILVRDPLYILTSWWSLQVLELNKELLADHGISMQKINYMHEKSLVAQAHDVVARHGTLPTVDVLSGFLQRQSAYMMRFLERWGWQEGESAGAGLGQIVPFEQIGAEVIALLERYRDRLEPDAGLRLDRFVRDKADFHPRKSPFEAPSEMLHDYMISHAELFQETATRILERDRSGLLARIAGK